jgi:hypothetical protein
MPLPPRATYGDIGKMFFKYFIFFFNFCIKEQKYYLDGAYTLTKFFCNRIRGSTMARGIPST